MVTSQLSESNSFSVTKLIYLPNSTAASTSYKLFFPGKALKCSRPFSVEVWINLRAIKLRPAQTEDKLCDWRQLHTEACRRGKHFCMTSHSNPAVCLLHCYRLFLARPALLIALFDASLTCLAVLVEEKSTTNRQERAMHKNNTQERQEEASFCYFILKWHWYTNC